MGWSKTLQSSDGSNPYKIQNTTTVTPSTKVVKHAGKIPAIHDSAFVAPTASVIGQVSIGKGSSVWYGATLRGTYEGDRFVSDSIHGHKHQTGAPNLNILSSRTTAGDVNRITVGEQSSIGDKAVVHVAKLKNDLPTHIGSRVTIGACMRGI